MLNVVLLVHFHLLFHFPSSCDFYPLSGGLQTGKSRLRCTLSQQNLLSHRAAVSEVFKGNSKDTEQSYTEWPIIGSVRVHFHLGNSKQKFLFCPFNPKLRIVVLMIVTELHLCIVWYIVLKPFSKSNKYFINLAPFE